MEAASSDELGKIITCLLYCFCAAIPTEHPTQNSVIYVISLIVLQTLRLLAPSRFTLN